MLSGPAVVGSTVAESETSRVAEFEHEAALGLAAACMRACT